jgi:Zn-dependent M28 family amino/carboxypeptidase
MYALQKQCMSRWLALFCLGVSATAAANDAAPWSFIKPDAIRGHVEFLADDLLEGRAAASRGFDIAAAYVAASFRQSGLKPAGADGSYYQTVPLIEATPVLPGSEAQLVDGDDEIDFEYGMDYLPSADFTSASSTLSAPLVFAGFGVEAPELNHDDFANIDVKGRIAVVLSGAPAKFGHAQRAYYSWSTRKYSTLIAHGAVGAVIVDSLADAQRVPWERGVAMSWVPQMRWMREDGKPHQAFEELKLRFRFDHEAAAKFFERADRKLEDVLAAAEAGEAQGFELPGLLTLTATTGLRRTESANVLAIVPGADPALKEEYVVISAHLDHLGRGSAVEGDAIYNGAHDNAVGIGILLEMARALNASGTKPRRSLLFAAVTAEEKGLLGSDYLAENPPAPRDRIVANVNIDMPMLFARTADLVALGAEHSTLGIAARAAAAGQGYRLSPNEAPEEVGFIRSDQFSFIQRGIPAMLLHSGYQARDASVDVKELQRNFRREHYHQPSDDLRLPIDYAAAADLARVNLRIALDVANAAPRPHWRRGDFFEQKFGRPPQSP